MKYKLVLLLAILLYFSGCENEKDDMHDIDIVFTDIKAYPNDSVSLDFNIKFRQEDSNFTVEWISPGSLKNNTNGVLFSTTDIVIEIHVLDNKRQLVKNIRKIVLIDTILSNSNYDFRNNYTGDFLFSIHHYRGSIDIGNCFDTTYRVNGFILKKGELSNSLLEINYGTDTIFCVNENGVNKVVKENSDLVLAVDNSLSYPGGIGGYGHTRVYGKYITTDSLSLNVSSGGLGFWNTRIIVAVKKNKP